MIEENKIEQIDYPSKPTSFYCRPYAAKMNVHV